MKYLIICLSAFLLAQVGQAQQWKEINNLRNPRSSTASVSKDGKVYYISGFIVDNTGKTVRSKNMEVYDEKSAKSEQIYLPEDLLWPAIAAGDSGIYIFGGTNASGKATAKAYLYKRNFWYTLDTMPGVTTVARTCKVGSKIAVGGGYISANSTSGVVFTDEVYFYDEAKESWETQTLSQTKLSYAMASDDNQNIYFAGGFTDSLLTTVTKQVDIYNLNSKQWRTENLSMARADMCAAHLNGKVYFAGGNLPGHNTGSDVVDIYDGSNWLTPETLSAKRGFIQPAVLHNQLIFVGGSTRNGTSLDVHDSYDAYEVYDGTSDTWSSGTLNDPRLLSGVSATENYVYAGAGLNIVNGVNKGYLSSVEVYSKYLGFQLLENTSNVRVFPNPCKDYLSITGVEETTNYEIYDQLGQKIKSDQLQMGANNIELTELPEGLYFLHLNNEVKRIIKQ